MHRSEQVQIVDLLIELKNLILDQRVSVDIYGTSREDSYLSGINEGLDKAAEVLIDFDVKKFLEREANK